MFLKSAYYTLKSENSNSEAANDCKLATTDRDAIRRIRKIFMAKDKN